MKIQPLKYLAVCVLCSLNVAPSLVLAKPAKQPNIVLLISDDDDNEHFGFMGSEIAQTPTLDKLAAAGTAFTTVHCPAPLCRPSLASLLSGRLPHQHGIYGNYLDRKGIGKDTTKLAPAGSLANRLKDAGYATYATGKYWEGDSRAMGFTHGSADTSMSNFKKFVREGQDELYQFIDEQHEDKPMFIWWAPLVPHTPHNPPPKYSDRFANVEIPIPSFYKGDREKYVAGMRKYYAMGTWFDDGVAQLIEKLKAAGEYENTLFLFYVDNGWAFGMPAKNSPSEKGLRTPMFVTWPGEVPAGKRIDSLNYALDLHATALDYAGLEVPNDIVSKSLRPQIDGVTSEPHDVLFGATYAHAPYAWQGDPSVKRTVERDVLALYARTKRWKYVLHTQDINQKKHRYVWMIAPLSEPYVRQEGEEDLYDLDADPYERNNLANQPGQKERVSELRRQALGWWKQTGGSPLEVAAYVPPGSSAQASDAEPRVDEAFFNGKDLAGWAGDMKFWSVEDGAIIGTAGDQKIPGNQFLWHKTPVKDFRLTLKVKQTPYSANAGIQFRSTRIEKGAHGYQGDVGKGWWGTLYHEHGRKILARSADAEEENINREDWNHYEILAVGHRIWIAINGKVTVALRDEFGELSGQIAVQIHGGAAQTVAYKDLSLTHNPEIELAGMNETALDALLIAAKEMGTTPNPKARDKKKKKKKPAANPEKRQK